MLGPKLREIRENRNLGQEEVAAAAGMSTFTLSRIETEKREATVSEYEAICRALRVAPGDLLQNSAGFYVEFTDLLTRLQRVEPRRRSAVAKVLEGILLMREEAVADARLVTSEGGASYHRKPNPSRRELPIGSGMIIGGIEEPDASPGPTEKPHRSSAPRRPRKKPR